MLHAFFNLPAAQLKLNQCIASVIQMKNSICFQVITIMIILQLTSECLRVYFQIPDAEAFKDEPKSLKISLQVFRC